MFLIERPIKKEKGKKLEEVLFCPPHSHSLLNHAYEVFLNCNIAHLLYFPLVISALTFTTPFEMLLQTFPPLVLS